MKGTCVGEVEEEKESYLQQWIHLGSGGGGGCWLANYVAGSASKERRERRRRAEEKLQTKEEVKRPCRAHVARLPFTSCLRNVLLRCKVVLWRWVMGEDERRVLLVNQACRSWLTAERLVEGEMEQEMPWKRPRPKVNMHCCYLGASCVS